MIQKLCSKCKQTLPASAFYKDLRLSLGLRSVCKQCEKLYHYSKDGIRRAALESHHRRKKRAKEYVDSIKRGPCRDCGNCFDPICMDFDHLADKKYEICQLTKNGAPINVLQAEIAKCELVCACCHRLRTKRRNDLNNARKRLIQILAKSPQ